MKSYNDCRTLEEREAELRTYASGLVGFPYKFGIPDEILLMPEQEAREYMRDVRIPDTLRRTLELISDIKSGKLEVSKQPIYDAFGNECYPILDVPEERLFSV